MQAGSIAAEILSPAYTFGTDDVGPGRLRLHDQIQAELRPDRLQHPPISPRMRNRSGFASCARSCAAASGFTPRRKTPCASSPNASSSAKNTPQRAGASTSTPTLPKDGEINANGMDKVMQLLVEDGSPNATAAEERHVRRYELHHRSAAHAAIVFTAKVSRRLVLPPHCCDARSLRCRIFLGRVHVPSYFTGSPRWR